jgi:DMSO/TMAO reductase YedYZ molybdopterin-dependent catalytic subunit
MGTHEFCNSPSRSTFSGPQTFSRRRFTDLFTGTLCLSGLELLSGQPIGGAETSSFDLSLLNGWAVANNAFFTRDHFSAPTTSSDVWTIWIGGDVAAPFTISYEELIRQPRKDLALTIECAENPVGGGLVSNAEWTGTKLATLLERAKPVIDARYVRLWGVDNGYARIIPLSKAMHSDTTVAWLMNGERLPASHGFPVRALIPGWYGMDSVKWLQKIEVLREGSNDGYLRRSQARQTEPVSAMCVKAVFARPLNGAKLFGRRIGRAGCGVGWRKPGSAGGYQHQWGSLMAASEVA